MSLRLSRPEAIPVDVDYVDLVHGRAGAIIIHSLKKKQKYFLGVIPLNDFTLVPFGGVQCAIFGPSTLPPLTGATDLEEGTLIFSGLGPSKKYVFTATYSNKKGVNSQGNGVFDLKTNGSVTIGVLADENERIQNVVITKNK